MKNAIVLFAHGSRDPLWRAFADTLAERLRERAPQTTVCCAFLELMSPSLGEAVAQLVDSGHTRIRIVPLFLGVGRHAREDLPQLVQALRQSHPQLQLDLQPPVGERPELIACMAELALRDL